MFIGTLLITIVGSQLVIQYDLRTKNEDARLVNMAGRQRMLSQRISKLTFYLNQKGGSSFYQIDTLERLVDTFEATHKALKNENKETGWFSQPSPTIDSLLKANDVHVNEMVGSCREVLANVTSVSLQNAVAVLEQHELPYLLLMEQTVAQYQKEAEHKLRKLKRIELALSIFALLLLLGEFVFIFRPLIERLTSKNRKLMDLNNQLAAANEELQATEEELRSNLEQREALQDQLAKREKQYRELVEGVSDMIFELDQHGKFVFVNTVVEHQWVSKGRALRLILLAIGSTRNEGFGNCLL